ncbi:hypothetical protein VTK26DRAFT_4320 [Humicola hyalothermophila]
MASKRALASSMPCIARLSSPILARAPAARQSLSRPGNITLASTAFRRAHSIPRPRNGPSPFTTPPSTTSPPQQQQQQPSSATSTSQPTAEPAPRTPNILQQPHYELTFTCRPCGTRSRHRVSKQGYHHGSVLVACPGCRNRHVISDHLRIFGDKSQTVEDILRERRGELVKKGVVVRRGVGGGGGGGGSNGVDGEAETDLGEGDLEFWDDGTTTARVPWGAAEEEANRRNKIGGRTGQGEAEWGSVTDPNAPPGASFKSVKPGERSKSDE